MSVQSLANRISALAPGVQLTAIAMQDDDGAPRARFVAARLGPDMLLRFATHLSSAKIARLNAEPRVSATMAPAGMVSPEWLQIDGAAEISTSAADRHEFWFDALRAYVSGPDDPDYAVVTIRPATIAIASMTAAPEVWQAPA